MVEGELSLGSGWWLQLPQPFQLSYDDEEGAVVLQTAVMFVQPQVFTFDAGDMTEPVGQIATGIVADTVADSSGELSLLGSLTGPGWSGSWCGGRTDAEADEYQVTASLGAGQTILNLTIAYLGSQTEEQAHWLVQHTVYRPDTVELTNQLSAIGAHLSVPPESFP